MIRLYKGGTSGFSNTGNEPYSEFYAAQIAELLGVNSIETYLKNLRSREPLDTFRDEDWLAMVDYITVHSKKDIRVTFKDGTEIKT